MKRIDDLMDSKTQENLRKDFIRDGYVLFPNFLSDTEIAIVKNKLDLFIENQVPKMSNKEVYYEVVNDMNTLKQLQQLCTYDSFFYEMMFGSRFEKLAFILLGDEVKGKNIQYFNKPAIIGKATPPHQDGYYFMLQPNEAVTIWMGLEPADESNGCMRYIKGSHRTGLRSHGRTETLGFSQGITDFGCPTDQENEVFFATKAGDLLVHHSLTIHRAGANTSSRTRKAMGFIYYANKAKENTAAHSAYANQLAVELATKNKI